ncbi:MAG: cell division topological specificity factor MinE [Lachnospiraceae bacterium]
MRLTDFFRGKRSSDMAKDRLKLMLVTEQVKETCSPEMMEQMRNDIIAVISKYVEVDTDGLDFQLTEIDLEGSDKSAPALYANIPIKGRRRS